MAKMETITVGKELYSGRTKTAATESALKHLALFMNGMGFMPIVVVSAIQDVGVVFRDEDGWWAYAIRWHDRPDAPLNKNTGKWTRTLAERNMRRHLAQQEYVPGQPANVSILDHSDQEGIKDHIRWCLWQTKVKEGRDQGMSDQEARAYADRAMSG